MYIFEILTRDHKDFGRNHACSANDESREDPSKARTIFVGNIRKDWLSPDMSVWEDCTVYDVYIEPCDEDPDHTTVIVQFSGGDGCNFSMQVGSIEKLLEYTRGSTERSMTYAYALRLVQHHRCSSNTRGQYERH